MLRFFGLLDRRRDLDLAQFSKHWRTVHRSLALRLVDAGIMRGYVQNHRRDVDVPGLAPAADGVPELWIDDAGMLDALAASPAYLEGAALDEPNFMESESRPFLADSLVRQSSLPREAVAQNVKLMLFFSARPEIDRSAVSDAWRSDGSMIVPDEDAIRAELHVSIEGGPAGTPFTHIEALWWRDRADFERAWSGKNDGRARRLIVPGSLAGMLVEELPVLWPPSESSGRNA